MKKNIGGESLEDIAELINEEIRGKLLEDINSRYSKHVSKVEITLEDGASYASDLRYRLEALLQESFIPWAFQRDNEIVITNSVLKLLSGLSVDSLKSLAERFGWAYRNVKIGRRVIKAIRVSLEDFLAFLEPEIYREPTEYEKDSDEVNEIEIGMTKLVDESERHNELFEGSGGG